MTREESKKLEQNFKMERKLHLLIAKAEPNKYSRFLKITWHYCSFPFIWLWKNLKDWKTAVIFVIVFLVVSSEVWAPYLIAAIIGFETPTGIALVSFASACWLFWLGPATPFLPLCIVITIGIKALFNKLRNK